MDSNFLGPICAFGSSATWAVGSSQYSRLSKNYSSFSVNFARALVALPLFILATFLTAGGITQGLLLFKEIKLTHWGWFALSMTASYGLGDSLFLMSARHLGVPAALTIASFYPAWTVMGGYFWGGVEVSIQQGMGLILSILGLIIVILSSFKPDGFSKKRQWSVTGILLAFATSVSWATNGFAVFQSGTQLSPSVGNTIRMLVALPICFVFSQIVTPRSSIILPKKELFRNFWVFVIEAFLGSYFYLYGISHTPIALGSILASLAPVISVPVALVLGLEKFSLFKTLGVVWVVGGISLLMGSF